MPEWTPPPGSPTAGRAFLWPAVVSVGLAAAATVLAGLFALPILIVGLLLSGVAAWARLPADQSVPRLVVLLIAAGLLELLIVFHFYPGH